MREAERAIERVAQEVALGGALEPLIVQVDEPSRAPVTVADLRKGMRVWVTRLRAAAEVMDVLPGEMVRVAAGPLKLKVPASDLRATAPAEEAPATPRRAGLSRTEGATEAPFPTKDCTCDLRGMSVDDAIAMAQSFLDRAFGEGQRSVFFVHGHGTGVLREELRKELARSACVARIGGAEAQHGGDAVTVVWLA